MALLAGCGLVGLWLLIGVIGYACQCCATAQVLPRLWICGGPITLGFGIFWCVLTRYDDPSNEFRRGWTKAEGR